MNRSPVRDILERIGEGLALLGLLGFIFFLIAFIEAMRF